jgi:hypothetical protein
MSNGGRRNTQAPKKGCTPFPLTVKEKVTDLVAIEVPFGNAWSVADAVGINFKREEVRVVECKATKGDFTRDTKLFQEKTSYFNHAHYAYIMCPTDVIKPEEVPYGYGLLWVNDYDNVTVAKKAIKNTKRLKTLFATTMKNTAKTLTNTMLYHKENSENKDETQGKFSRNAKIKLIAVRCPACKKYAKDLIYEGKTKSIKCKCKNEIDLTKAKIREVTGFNDAFIKRINKLKEVENDG